MQGRLTKHCVCVTYKGEVKTRDKKWCSRTHLPLQLTYHFKLSIACQLEWCHSPLSIAEVCQVNVNNSLAHGNKPLIIAKIEWDCVNSQSKRGWKYGQVIWRIMTNDVTWLIVNYGSCSCSVRIESKGTITQIMYCITDIKGGSQTSVLPKKLIKVLFETGCCVHSTILAFVCTCNFCSPCRQCFVEQMLQGVKKENIYSRA